MPLAPPLASLTHHSLPVMSPTVDALLTLSLLEAVRTVDTPATPDGEYDAEFVAELRNKRLGLSDTVYSQIRRYTDAVKRNQRTAQDEAVALARLIGRRADAEAVFRAAGRYLAREAYGAIAPFTRQLMRALPSLLARPIAFRRARWVAERYFNGTLTRVGGFLMLEVPASVTREAAPGMIGCTFYEAALRELLRLLIGGTGAVDHVRCRGRGEDTCEWRAEWRSIDLAKSE